MSEKMIFCLGEGKYESKGDGYQKNYMAFNKKVSEERYKEILNLIREDILKELKLELDKEGWPDEWKKVTNQQWKRILEIPEADQKVIEGIIGFELDIKETQEMTLAEVCKELGRDIKIKK